MKKYRILGIMSGTSLDGLDLALCEFDKDGEGWQRKIYKAETFRYSEEWRNSLENAHLLNGYDLAKLDFDYGHLIGKLSREFCQNFKNKVDYISSHGHTIFHMPSEGVTVQIGNGAAIAASSGISTICNFRTMDVALGGQGAPLVPIGDALLFNDYDFCLNLGGFANVSFNWYRKRVAYDICPVNFIINQLVKPLGMEYDDQGKEARKGILNTPLLRALNSLDYYSQQAPKSLGREWVEHFFMPLIENSTLSLHDKLRTVYEHIAIQLSHVFTGSAPKKVLVTGGGAYNTFLIELFRKHSNFKVILPEKEIIEYKEALVFAFLGLMRIREEKNCLASVTGSKHDCIGGVVYQI